MDKQKRYRVTVRETGEVKEVTAPFAEEACDKLGLYIGDCYIRELIATAADQDWQHSNQRVRARVGGRQ